MIFNILRRIINLDYQGLGLLYTISIKNVFDAGPAQKSRQSGSFEESIMKLKKKQRFQKLGGGGGAVSLLVWSYLSQKSRTRKYLLNEHKTNIYFCSGFSHLYFLVKTTLVDILCMLALYLLLVIFMLTFVLVQKCRNTVSRLSLKTKFYS